MCCLYILYKAAKNENSLADIQYCTDHIEVYKSYKTRLETSLICEKTLIIHMRTKKMCKLLKWGWGIKVFNMLVNVRNMADLVVCRFQLKISFSGTAQIFHKS